MNTNPLQQALDDVMHSLEGFHRAFEDQVTQQRHQGKDETSLAELTKGAIAMKDSAEIYLAWANHYMKRLNKTDGPDMDEMMEA